MELSLADQDRVWIQAYSKIERDELKKIFKNKLMLVPFKLIETKKISEVQFKIKKDNV